MFAGPNVNYIDFTGTTLSIRLITYLYNGAVKNHVATADSSVLHRHLLVDLTKKIKINADVNWLQNK